MQPAPHTESQQKRGPGRPRKDPQQPVRAKEGAPQQPGQDPAGTKQITLSPAEQESHWKRAKVHIEKGDHATEKAEQHYVTAALHLKALKEAHTGTWAEWEILVKEKAGIGASRASQIMQLADGSKTLADLRKDAAKRKQDQRDREAARKKLEGPADAVEKEGRRQGKNVCDVTNSIPDKPGIDTAEASAEARKQEYADQELTPEERAAKESAKALEEFKVACRIWLPKMSLADRERAIEIAEETRNQLAGAA